MAIPPVPAPTVASIEAAKAAQQRDRADVMKRCDVVFDEDGRMYWTADQIVKGRTDERDPSDIAAVD